MVGLTKIDEFNHKLLVQHYICRFEIEMGDLILLEVAQTLSDDVTEVDLCLVADGIPILLHELG